MKVQEERLAVITADERRDMIRKLDEAAGVRPVEVDPITFYSELR